MVDFVFDEIVAAVEMLAVDAMSITELLFDEAEATAEFLVAMAAWMLRGFSWAPAGQNSGRCRG